MARAYSYDMNINMVNSTLYQNSATGRSGGNIKVYGYANDMNVNITNSTISHGSGSSGGGNIITVRTGGDISLTVVNTIVANPVSGDNCDITNASSSVTFGSVNNIFEGGCGTTDTQTGQLNSDPMLGTLADNGGPLPTMALLTGSPAIDAGVNVRSSTTFSEVAFGFDLNGDGDATDIGLNIEDIAYDARGTGFARVTGGTIDIGAFEFGSESISTPTVHWDIDANGSAAISDGSLVLRYLLGFRDEVLINDAIAQGASLTTADAIEAVIQVLVDDSTLDIDDNNNENTFDGSLLLRYLLGYRGQTLINGAVGQGANRSSSTAIQAYIELPE